MWEVILIYLEYYDMEQKHNDEYELALLFLHRDLTVSEIIDSFAKKNRIQLKQHLPQLSMQWQQIIISWYPTFNLQTLCDSMYFELIKLIWMIVDKLYSNVGLFILTSYIMVLCHNFLYIQKIFLGQKLDLFIIINYI